MKKDINISQVLKVKPLGTKLYSPLYGEGKLIGVSDNFITIKYKVIVSENGAHSPAQFNTAVFFSNGKYYKCSPEIMLFPSKEMKDWNKFTWKKGDVLVCNKGKSPTYCIFEEFENNNYTTFKAKYKYKKGSNYYENFSSGNITNLFKLAHNTDANLFHERLSNIIKHEFKNRDINLKEGDYICIKGEEGTFPIYGIYKRDSTDILKSVYVYIACINFNGDFIINDKISIEGKKIRKATKLEKSILNAELISHNMIWNPHTKTIKKLHENESYISNKYYYSSTISENIQILYTNET